MIKTVFKVGLLAVGTTALLAAVGSYFVVKYNDANDKVAKDIEEERPEEDYQNEPIREEVLDRVNTALDDFISNRQDSLRGIRTRLVMEKDLEDIFKKYRIPLTCVSVYIAADTLLRCIIADDLRRYKKFANGVMDARGPVVLMNRGKKKVSYLIPMV